MAKYFFGFILVGVLAGCSIHLDGAQYTPESLPRVVLDEDAQQPVSHAYVIFTWWETAADLSQSRTQCARKEFRMTDSQGRFEIPSWRGAYPTVADIYKPGMVRVRSKREKEGVELVRTSKAMGEGRYDELTATAGRLSCEGGDRELLPIRQALLDEAQAIRSPQTAQRVLDRFEIARDAAKYGRDEANRLYDERLMSRKRGDSQ